MLETLLGRMLKTCDVVSLCLISKDRLIMTDLVVIPLIIIYMYIIGRFLKVCLLLFRAFCLLATYVYRKLKG